ncbi:DUF58 domain-containing protein [Luteimonas sp. MC1782]|uniref:DUF58 domain-containing protein n=1 Tax=Luteimonas sp. MC1782 TaxID=2760305 RepID=UPI0031B86052
MSNQAATATGGDGITPSLAELIGLRGIAQARVTARRGAAGVAGPAPSTLRGRGMEYAESRAYAAGDDARHIDWRLTARSGKPHTKLFQAERERLTLLVADTSPALYFGTRVRFKSVQAARAGALAAWRAVRDGDRVAALRGSMSEPPVPPASGARGALRVLDALVRWYSTPPPDDAGLDVALDHARRLLRPGSRLLVLSDPASVAAVPEKRWPALAAHHEVLVLLLTDPLEMEPPRGLLAFSVASTIAAQVGAAASDSARRARIELDLGNNGERDRWRLAFDGGVEQTIATLAGRGVRALRLSTADESDAWLALPAAVARSA